MPDTQEEELVEFDRFRELVGATERQVRRAIRELGIRPVPVLSDLRKLRYPVAKVEEVRQWILDQREI
jgi:hypothetical protein